MRRVHVIILLFLLVLLLLFIGNYIHKSEIFKSTDSLDAYIKSNKDKKTILVEVDSKTLYLIDNNSQEIIKKYSIATGKPKSPTPLGSYQITNKGKWGEGFGSRWMGLDVPWGIYGIHGTNKPGSIGLNASAGCIRMRNGDIEDLFERVGEGTRVLITNGLYGPFGHGFRNLRPGATGADVLEVQKRLFLLGYYNSSLDGIYGEGMKKSLIEFLKENNISLTDEVSPDIYEKLGIILME